MQHGIDVVTLKMISMMELDLEIGKEAASHVEHGVDVVTHKAISKMELGIKNDAEAVSHVLHGIEVVTLRMTSNMLWSWQVLCSIHPCRQQPKRSLNGINITQCARSLHPWKRNDSE